ncbi:MAG TPA: PadR family transcriptional regulator [Caulobacteraceae bacterium]|jgi:DNA-binding PadR family transcriptional regulator|nr:PadR family transcriptional regulator [Caulobacteraceae bacterium]
MTLRSRTPSKQTRDVLSVLLERRGDWLHGYELTKLTGLSSGTLYPLLIRLHERGHLEARWVESEQKGRPERHVYRLSVQGAAFAHGLDLQMAQSLFHPAGAIG